MNNKYKAVIFDLFHTLTSANSVNAPGRETADILGVSQEQWNAQIFNYSNDRLTGKNKDAYEIVREMAHVINPAITEDTIKEATESRVRRFNYALINIDPKVQEVLKKVEKLNILMGLLSNADVQEVSAWDQSPIKYLFDSVVFSCDVGFVKPQAEIYEISLKQLGVKPDEVLFVGDGGCDELKGAQEVGIKTVLMTEFIKKLWPEKIIARRQYADYEIDDLKKLLDII